MYPADLLALSLKQATPCNIDEDEWALLIEEDAWFWSHIAEDAWSCFDIEGDA
jgi:hypothetical protein